MTAKCYLSANNNNQRKEVNRTTGTRTAATAASSDPLWANHSRMCKMLFIGIKTEQQEIPFVAAHPDFHIEKVSGEYLPVQQVFSNPYVYVTGTSRGCSCDFGIKSNQRSESTIVQVPPFQKVLNKVRKQSGSYAQWEKRHEEKVGKALHDKAQYLNQTLQLVSIIESEIQKGNPVELFCTWAGDYGASPEFQNTIDTKKVDIRADFEIEEKEFKTFI
jgi:hypothetical protein